MAFEWVQMEFEGVRTRFEWVQMEFEWVQMEFEGVRTRREWMRGPAKGSNNTGAWSDPAFGLSSRPASMIISAVANAGRVG